MRRKELYRYVKLNFVSDGVFPSFILIVVVILNSKSGVEDFFLPICSVKRHKTQDGRQLGLVLALALAFDIWCSW